MAEDDTRGRGVDVNDRMGREVEYLRRRLDELEMRYEQQKQQQQPQQQQRQPQKQQQQPQKQELPSRGITVDADADVDSAAAVDGVGGGDIRAVTNNAEISTNAKRNITWRDHVMEKLDTDGHANRDENATTPPIGNIKFLCPRLAARDAIDDAVQPLAPSATGGGGKDGANAIDANEIDRENASQSSSYASTSSSEEEDAGGGGEIVAFAGEARVYFQARHHRQATQIVPGLTTSPSLDTYLRVLVVHRADASDGRWSELRILPIDGVSPLIDPPVPLRHFYAAKVPGSHSTAALFPRNDPRRLRRYVFRFEFSNRACRHPPSRHIQFVRSGRVAKKSMIRRPTWGMAKRALGMTPTLKAGEGRGGGGGVGDSNTRARDALDVYLIALAELLRESDDAADMFVECVNTFNDAAWEEEEEEKARLRGDGVDEATMAGGRARRRRKRAKPPPPYWGGGYNSRDARPTRTTDDEDDDDSDSDYNDSEDEDEELMNYDDDNDDETLFDRVTVSAEQALETLYNHIVK